MKQAGVDGEDTAATRTETDRIAALHVQCAVGED